VGALAPNPGSRLKQVLYTVFGAFGGKGILATPQSSSLRVRVETPEECRALVERICASPHFQRSPRVRQLLLHVTTHALEGNQAALKESAIGEALYGRTAGYNTNDDNVVRMGVTQLRRKLAEYFDHEGRDEALRVDIPKGSYIPAFSRLPSGLSTSMSRKTSLGLFRRTWRTSVTILAAAILALVTLVALRGQHRSVAAGSDTLFERFWQEAIGDGRSTLFVSEDLGYLLGSESSEERLTVDDYAEHRTLPADPEGLLSKLRTYQATTQLSLRIAARLLASQPVRLSHASFLPSREIGMRDFKEKNLILVGSPRACPWIGLFRDTLNFQFDYDRVHIQSSFRNRQPRPGEQALYMAPPAGQSGGTVYSVVALLPNLGHSGKVLILTGTREEGTEAAADVVTTPYVLKDVLRSIGYDGAAPLPFFEVLLESRRLAGVSMAPHVLGSRVYPGATGTGSRPIARSAPTH